MKRLEGFWGCAWEIASIAPREFEVVRKRAYSHGNEAAIIETCQRIEVYGLEPCDCGAPLRSTGFDALLRLAEVTAGLHSAVRGEVQVTGQVRRALANADPDIRHVAGVALAAARELRRIEGFEADAGQLLDVGLEAAGADAGGSLLILGAGHQARLTGRRAVELGFAPVVFASRRKPETDWFKSDRYRYLPLDQVSFGDGFDVVVGCLGAGAEVLDVASALPPVGRLVLDLGTPRNFSGSNGTPIVALADVLRRVCDDEREADTLRLRAALRRILERRVAMAADDSQSAVGALRQSVEQVRQEQLERLSRLHPDIPGEVLDSITRSLVNQLFHRPSERLRDIEDPVLGEQVARLFAPAVEQYEEIEVSS